MEPGSFGARDLDRMLSAGGSTYGTREMFRIFAEFFAMHGVAGLIYDKRGLGGSTGDWLRAGFEELAGDTLAGVRMLKLRPDIDARRIGLMGASQSGWIVALAASQSKDVAFIISQSGPGIGPDECELYRSEAWLRADGFSEEEPKTKAGLPTLAARLVKTIPSGISGAPSFK